MKKVLIMAIIAIGSSIACTQKAAKSSVGPTEDSIYVRKVGTNSILKAPLLKQAMENLPDKGGFRDAAYEGDKTVTLFTVNNKTKSQIVLFSFCGIEVCCISENCPDRKVDLCFSLHDGVLSVQGSTQVKGGETTKLTYSAVELLVADGYQSYAF